MVSHETIVQPVGFLAGLLTTIAFLPQLLKVYRSKSAKDISLPMFLLFTSGVLLWFLYGVFLREPPIMITNAVTFILAVTILALKLRYDKQ